MDMQRLLKQLRLHEGEKNVPYKCTADKWTIGVGRNFEDVRFSKAESKAIFGDSEPISLEEKVEFLEKNPLRKEQIDMLLENDIKNCVKQMSKYGWWKAVQGDDVRERVLVDLCFNMGITTLLTFKNTLKYVEMKKFSHAAANLKVSKWYRQVKTRGVRIVEMMRTGIDSKDF